MVGYCQILTPLRSNEHVDQVVTALNCEPYFINAIDEAQLLDDVLEG